jgi:hypothetical protein
MIELISQHGDAPSALRDMYAANEFGIHHVATFVPDARPPPRTSPLVSFSSRSRRVRRPVSNSRWSTCAQNWVTWSRSMSRPRGSPISTLCASLDWNGDEPVRHLRL